MPPALPSALRLALPPALLAVATALAGSPGLRASRPNSPAPPFAGRSALLGYPAPTGATPTRTATPSPDADGRYPPPVGVPYRVASMEASPFASELRWLADALGHGDAGALAAATGSASPGLVLGRYVESEGSGAWPAPFTVERWLADLFVGGSRPVIQGLFADGCDPVGQPCTFVVVSTGWQGDLALPTRSPDEPLGPLQPPAATVLVAGWELAQDGAGGVRWRAWWLGDGYHELVNDLARRGLGPFTVLRQGRP